MLNDWSDLWERVCNLQAASGSYPTASPGDSRGSSSSTSVAAAGAPVATTAPASKQPSPGEFRFLL